MSNIGWAEREADADPEDEGVSGAGPVVTRRRDARRLAMTIIYSQTITGEPLEMVMGLVRDMRPDWKALPDFTVKLCETVMRSDDEIDAKIGAVLENWRLVRISPVERTLLRLGCAEILYFQEIPPRVTINEYIELSKLFANENAPAFINGILDKLVHQAGKPDARR